MKQLTHIDLGGTYVLGTIPYCIGNLVNIVYMY
eukprot:jgi/Mesen1/769/ME000110S_11034